MRPRKNETAGRSKSFKGKSELSGRREGSTTSKGRSKPARGRDTADSKAKPTRSERPAKAKMIDPRHTRGASKSLRPKQEEARSSQADSRAEKRSYNKPKFEKTKFERSERDPRYSRTGRYKPAETAYKPAAKDGTIRLNKFLSNAGIASRREADRLIELGLVTVNGKQVTELGYKVDPAKDVVKYDDVALRPERMRYVLLNKPKDYITTMDDPEGRKTVMFLVKDACNERIYPVGRLDRQTTGLLLFTNDGELAKRLTHPKHGFPKLYHVETIEKVQPKHLDQMREGIELEDGIIAADEVSYVNNDPRQVGIKIHSGKNRIVRRTFEHLGYTVKKLDRVMFGGLTKKDLPRGKYRHLTEQEVSFLKMIR